MKIVTIDSNLCAGCKQCAMNCSFQHERVYSVSQSRIKYVTFEEKCFSAPVTCVYCEDSPCVHICPTGAMTNDSETGIAKVLEHICIGCKECANVCPVGAIDMHPIRKVAMRCDLCGGNPQCVASCPTGALKYEDVSIAMKDKRRRVILKHVANMMKEV